MTSYGQFCSIARASEVVGERWTLLVLRELLLESHTFTTIRRGLPGLPRATLAARLRTLTAAGLVEAAGDGYQLTDTGRRIEPVLRALAEWGGTSAPPLDGAHLDPSVLMWDVRRRIAEDNLDDAPGAIVFEFTDQPASEQRYWLVASRSSVDVCRRDPGHPVVGRISGPTRPIIDWWLGTLSWQAMLRSGVTLTAAPRWRRRLPTWFLGYVYPVQPPPTGDTA